MLLEAVADHDKGAGQYFQAFAVAAKSVHAALDIGIELLTVAEAAAAGEHRLCGFRRQLPAVVGRPGLNDDRPALHRAGDVERSAHAEIFALVIEHVHPGGIEIEARLDVSDKSVVGEGVPQARHYIIEFARPLVALGVFHMVFEPEIQRRIRI